jgi:hypothetical protein
MSGRQHKRVILTGAGRFCSSLRSGEASARAAEDLFAIALFLCDESLLDFSN